METLPSYYAVIPANVRYAKISSGSKLLYGEITALANAKGYCWASNDYFANLYSISDRQIRSWIKELIDAGFINSDVVKEQGNKRYITIVNPTEENFHTLRKKTSIAMEKNFLYNNTYNNTSNTSRSFSNENSQEEKGNIAFVEKIKKEEQVSLDTYDANASPVSVEKNKKKKSTSNTSVAKATPVFVEETIEILKFFADSFKTAEKKYFNKTKASQRIEEVLSNYSKEQVKQAITNYKVSKKGDFTYLKTPETFFGFEDDKKTRFIDRFIDSEIKPTIKLEEKDWMAGW